MNTGLSHEEEPDLPGALALVVAQFPNMRADEFLAECVAVAFGYFESNELKQAEQALRAALQGMESTTRIIENSRPR